MYTDVCCRFSSVQIVALKSRRSVRIDAVPTTSSTPSKPEPEQKQKHNLNPKSRPQLQFKTLREVRTVRERMKTRAFMLLSSPLLLRCW